MKFAKPRNANYCATVTKIKNIIPLENCDNVQGTFIFGGNVIISKDTKVGDLGLYFPPETQLSEKFLHHNNLYSDKELNINKEKSGYFSKNGRVRTVKFRGHQSIGFWIPIESLNFRFEDCSIFKNGDEFDQLDGIEICKKYIIQKNISSENNKKRKKLSKQEKNRIIENQFRFHEDTQQFVKNVHRFEPETLISITKKLHGTSVVISKVLCKRKLNIFQTILKKIGVPIVDYEYSNVYSSRKVIKNGVFQNENNHFYKVDIWGKANDKLKEYLEDGLTIYAEIVGFLPSGGYIQKPFDYGCNQTQFEVYVYRITYTNFSGKVFEFSAKQVQEWCKERGLNPVPELYYGNVNNLFCDLWIKNHGEKESHEDKNQKIMKKYGYKVFNFDLLITLLKEEYLEKNSTMCKNKAPEEGIVLRIEQNKIEAYKLKSFKFLQFETKQLDSGEEDIEEGI